MESGCLPVRGEPWKLSTHSLCHMLLWPLWSFVLAFCQFSQQVTVLSPQGLCNDYACDFYREHSWLTDEKSLPQKGFAISVMEGVSSYHVVPQHLLCSTTNAGAMLLEVMLFIVCLFLLECSSRKSNLCILFTVISLAAGTLCGLW
jgi:hypothetical protein